MTVTKIILITLVTISLVTSDGAVKPVSDQENISKILKECPCILRSICPRVFGESPDDIKYLGLMEDCDNKDEVRCCGVTATYIIGEPIKILTEKHELNPAQIIVEEISTTTESLEQDTEIISTKIQPYSSEENDSFRRIEDFTTELYSTIEDEFNVETTIADTNPYTDVKIFEDDTTDKYTATDIDLYPTTEELLIANEAQINYRQAKQLNNVSYVYPSEMSGIPKTTPKNLPVNHEMKSFDNKMGENILVVFSHDDTSEIMGTNKNEASTESIRNKIDPNFAELDVVLDSSNSDQMNIEAKIENKRRGYRPQRIRLTNQNENSTVSMKSDNSSVDVDIVERNRIQDISKRRRVPIKRTTVSPIVNNTNNLEATENTETSTRRTNLRLPTHPPRTLFNFDPSSRLNFLKRTLANHQQSIPTVDTDTVEETTEVQLNSTLRDLIDTQHKLMIEHVHTALKSRTVLSNFDAKDNVEPYNNGYEYLESMIRNRLAKLEEPVNNESDETIGFRTNLLTEMSKERVNVAEKQLTKKPFRGTKRYMQPTAIFFKDSSTTTSNDVTTKKFRRVRTTTPSTVDRTRIITTTEKSATPLHRRLFTRKPKESTLIKSATTSPTTTPTPITTTTTTTTAPTTSEELHESETKTQPEVDEVTSSIVSQTFVAVIPELLQIDKQINVIPTQFVTSINPLLADFRPSPLWTLHAEETPAIHIDLATSSRQSRDTFPLSPVEMLNGFQPLISTGVPLSVVGPIPSSLMVKNNEQPFIYELPLKEIQRQFQ